METNEESLHLMKYFKPQKLNSLVNMTQRENLSPIASIADLLLNLNMPDIAIMMSARNMWSAIV